MASTSATARRSACRCGRRWWRPAASATAARGTAPRRHRCCRGPRRRADRAARPSARSLFPAQAFASIAASNSLPSGSGPRPRSSGSLVELGARDQLHRAEAARIVEGHRLAVRHVKHHVVVRGALRALVIVDAGLGVLADAERARHAEMHDQHVAGRQIGQQIFRAPAEPFDVLPVSGACRSPWRSASAAARRTSTLLRRAPSIAGARPRRRFRLREARAWLTLACRAHDIAPALPRYGPARKGQLANGRHARDTHFGYETVPLGDKQGRVDDVSSSRWRAATT